MILSDIANINIGTIIRRLSRVDAVGQEHCYQYYTLSSAEYDQTIDISKLKDIETSATIDSKYISKQGDIIVGLSAPFSFAYIDNSTAGTIIPSQFALIRAKTHLILPEYLIAYLTSEYIIKLIDKSTKGMTVKTISIAVLFNLPIKLPDMQTQQQVAHLRSLILEENALNYQYAKLIEAKNNYYIDKLIKKAIK